MDMRYSKKNLIGSPKQTLEATINNIISKPYLLIPFKLRRLVEGILVLYSRLSIYPKNTNLNELNNFRNNVIIFLASHEFL